MLRSRWARRGSRCRSGFRASRSPSVNTASVVLSLSAAMKSSLTSTLVFLPAYDRRPLIPRSRISRANRVRSVRARAPSSRFSSTQERIFQCNSWIRHSLADWNRARRCRRCCMRGYFRRRVPRSGRQRKRFAAVTWSSRDRFADRTGDRRGPGSAVHERRLDRIEAFLSRTQGSFAGGS